MWASDIQPILICHFSYMTTADGSATLTESNIQAALIEARGDLFVASQMLGVTAIRLDRAIRVSTELQGTVLSLATERKDNQDFDRISVEELERAVSRRLALYRVDGLDALHDIATMPIGENPALVASKLGAAVRLAGGLEAGGVGSETSDILRELNAAYHASAPKIRIVRQTMTTVEMGTDEKVIESVQVESTDKAGENTR
jgi:hypothetical protein